MMQKKIGSSHETDGLYYLNDVDKPIVSVFSASVSPFQWHCRLGHSRSYVMILVTYKPSFQVRV